METMKGENLVANHISMCECKSISLLKEEPDQNMLYFFSTVANKCLDANIVG